MIILLRLWLMNQMIMPLMHGSIIVALLNDKNAFPERNDRSRRVDEKFVQIP